MICPNSSISTHISMIHKSGRTPIVLKQSGATLPNRSRNVTVRPFKSHTMYTVAPPSLQYGFDPTFKSCSLSKSNWLKSRAYFVRSQLAGLKSSLAPSIMDTYALVSANSTNAPPFRCYSADMWYISRLQRLLTCSCSWN